MKASSAHLALVGSSLEFGRRIGSYHCGPFTVPIANHPAFAPLANQTSGRRRHLVAHLLLPFLNGSAAVVLTLPLQ
jgi:hypothetical protein